MYDVLIIGCGITGAAAAFALSRYRLSIAVLERENDVSMGATKANSAILHAGYDPEPGTLMARLNLRGVDCALVRQDLKQWRRQKKKRPAVDLPAVKQALEEAGLSPLLAAAPRDVISAPYILEGARCSAYWWSA